jgi:hypothetical protein
LDVDEEIKQGSLLLSSDQSHLANGQFDGEAMLRGLEETLRQSLASGYKGLWATGDMAWEFGPSKDFSQLLDYEWRLEQFFQKNPELVGVCQYHADTMPAEAMRQGLLAHPAVFINESVALLNPHYVQPRWFTTKAEKSPEVESALDRLLQLEFSI